MKLIFSTIILLILFFFSKDIAMLGVKINDNQKSLDKLKLEIVAKEDNMIKYKTENNNDFSVTTENGKVVYMENDWLQDPGSRQPLFSNFTFGKTTLKEIRDKFDTNGFTYKSRGSFTTETDLITFNCFEFDSKNNEILVTITKVSLSEAVTEENVASKLKLDALIIADKSYLDKIWEKEKIYDTNFKKINP
jgi:hypothetical protein